MGRRRAGENGSIKDDKKVVGRRRRGKTVQAKTSMKVVFNTYCQEKGGKTAECATVVQGVQAKTTVKS